MPRAKNEKKFYRIFSDNRDLNYSKYFKKGNKNFKKFNEYNSFNTQRLSTNQMVKLLSKLNLNNKDV